MKTFDPKSTAFSLPTAILMAKHAQNAYLDGTPLLKAMKSLGFPNVEQFLQEETQGCVAWNDSAVVLSFRGTEAKLKDWETDFQAAFVPGPEGRVHRGFNRALEIVWPQVLNLLTPLWNQDRARSYWITGHSLGGALATLAAARLRFIEGDRPMHGVYTFGSPRVGDKNFGEAYNRQLMGRTFRFVNNNDIVPRVPPRLLGYTHVGTLEYLTEDGKLVDDIGFWNLLLDRARGALGDLGEKGLDAIKDHGIANYISILEQIEKPGK
ncbi:MAG: lipase family protein [Magnetococcales bacterium]|nr:lipase family protein [Magnetococcales bacterium]